MNDGLAVMRFLAWSSIIAGGFTLIVGIRSRNRSMETQSWPSTQGVVKSSAVVSHPQWGGGRSFEPVITYEYSVGGQIYKQSRLRVLGKYWNKEWAKGVTKRYPTGNRVTVYYDPAAPQQAVLEAGREQVGLWTIFAVALGLVALGSLFLSILPNGTHHP
jgi:hypothetical protein